MFGWKIESHDAAQGEERGPVVNCLKRNRNLIYVADYDLEC